MDRANRRALSVEEAKERLRESEPLPGPVHGALASLEVQGRRRPLAAAAVAFGLGVALGASARARQVAARALQKAIRTRT